MSASLRFAVLCLLCFGLLALAGCSSSPAPPEPIRVMTYNVEDIRTSDLKRSDHARMQRAAAIIQHLRPDILLLQEITYDQPGDPGYSEGDAPGQNARRFAENYLTVPQADSLEAFPMTAFMAPTNTGIASGHDLNNDGTAVTTVPEIPPAPSDTTMPPQNDAGRAYGEDAWGFGTFPGQYGMALLVREGLQIQADDVRTFRLFKWSDMPGARRPTTPETGLSWYDDDTWADLRLSSKSHWDVPVMLPDSSVLHVLASHPTPPGFDGSENRNGLRNYDEIRFWADYLDQAPHIYDDSTQTGGLSSDAHFVLMGDLNADPSGGSSVDGAIEQVLDHVRINAVTPMASPEGQRAFPDLSPGHTAEWGRRVDYVLPARSLDVEDSGVWRPLDPGAIRASDHFPVWIDIRPPGTE
jgi:endonuclease/exonuclease/phosphatase family metal-dependent hydrolase